MKLFSRTPSPISLPPPTPPPTPPRSPSTISTPSPSPSLHSSPPALPPRRPRLRHGPPPFFAGWAHIRLPHSPRRPHLRFCTLSGPTLRYSASPSQDILAATVLVYRAAVSVDEFPRCKIVVRPVGGGKIVLYPEGRKDFVEWYGELVRASGRCLTHVYRFRNDLRQGGFGRISVAEERGMNHVVCVKVIRKHQWDSRHVAMARKEAIVLLAMPQHDNCVAIVDMYESARTLYLVTEHGGGRTVAEWVAERGSVCEEDVAAVVGAVLRALTHLHRWGVVHRMVCPDNVVVAEAGKCVRLWNFEMAISGIDCDEAKGVVHSMGLEGPLGLRHAVYVAPEVAGGAVGGYEQDVWSAGILMHYLLVGCTPFGAAAGIDAALGMIGATRGRPSFSGPLWRGISSGAMHLCASMLHADPAERVSAAHALHHPWLNV